MKLIMKRKVGAFFTFDLFGQSIYYYEIKYSDQFMHIKIKSKESDKIYSAFLSDCDETFYDNLTASLSIKNTSNQVLINKENTTANIVIFLMYYTINFNTEI